MPIQTRKLHYKALNGQDAATHVGREGDLFFDPTTTTLRVSDGTTPGGNEISGGGGSSFTKQTYVSSGGSTSDVAIDLTKKCHVLEELDGAVYTVADGTTDGQELIFVPQYHANPANIRVNFNTTKLYYDAETRWNTSSFEVNLFSPTDTAYAITQTMRAMARAIWVIDSDGGAWHLDGGARNNV